MSKKLYDILLAEQKQTLLSVIELLVERKGTDDIFINRLYDLVNMLDYIEDEIKFRDDD